MILRRIGSRIVVKGLKQYDTTFNGIYSAEDQFYCNDYIERYTGKVFDCSLYDPHQLFMILCKDLLRVMRIANSMSNSYYIKYKQDPFGQQTITEHKLKSQTTTCTIITQENGQTVSHKHSIWTRIFTPYLIKDGYVWKYYPQYARSC